MLPFVRLWLWISAFASLAGWGLSAAGELNRTGYAVAAAAVAVFFLLRWKKQSTFNIQQRTSNEDARIGNVGRWMLNVECSTFLKKSFRRFRRPLPFCFGALAVLIFLGGAIHAPGNYTGLAYRAGRVLQWLSHGHWFWIDTEDFRMNDRACGIEWLSAPILLFTNSTRGLFLINFLPFLLLPGLIFSIFTRLGVRARVARHWMWLLPTGYNFILQAGGIANDTFPAVYALAAVDFGLRAWKSRLLTGWLAGTVAAPQAIAPPSAVRELTALPDLWHSILAAALLTGAKASNLPLLLPWAIVIFPLVPLLRRKPIATALVVLLAAAVSFLPTAILNVHYLGDWSGLSIERTGMAMKNPVVGVWGNALLLLLGNFTPPLFPFAGWWNAHALAALPHFISAPMIANFEPGFLSLGELPTEDWAGIGFGLSVLLAVSVIGSFGIRRLKHSTFNIQQPTSNSRQPGGTLSVECSALNVECWMFPLLRLAPWIALLAYTMKSGMVTPARLIAPYYPLLLPLLLAGAGQSQIVRRRWWRALAGGALVLAFVVLILTPDRPLWPAQTILSGLAARHPNQHLISRALDVYTVYAKRSDPLADVRALLPKDAQTVGFIGAEDDCDISLWLPLWSRRVEHFRLSDPPERFRQARVEYAVVGGLNLQLRGTTLDAWLQKTGAEVVASTNATQKVSEGPQAWHMVRFK
jgi:hypothetical protein